MDQKRWQQIESILDITLSMDDPEKQDAFIRSACGSDRQLYQAVSEILDHIRKAEEDGFLE